MSTPITTINLAVHNGEKYIRQCLDSVFKQSYPHELIEINILDNASTDSTIQEINKTLGRLVKNESNGHFDILIYQSTDKFQNLRLIKSNKNLGMWPAQEKLLEYGHGKYIVVLSVDVILHPDFIKNAVETMERDEKIGALQAKIYKFSLEQLPTTNYQLPTTTIDTLGFQIFRSRRIVNMGHGETQLPTTNYQLPTEIFAVEGAVPVFRREALEDCRLESQGGKIVEPDFFWYGDDLDLAWRMRVFSWKQVYAPSVIAWHDRKTTKVLAGGWREFIKIRKTVPMFKRRLDWRNTTLTIIKNDFAANWLRGLPFILWRQLRLWTYFLIFEPVMSLEIFNVAKMLPKMLKRRNEIMKKAKVSPAEFRQWIRS